MRRSVTATTAAVGMQMFAYGLDGVGAQPVSKVTRPPMGWMAWERFRCDIDCNDADKGNCIDQSLFREMADAMKVTGLDQYGYKQVSVDDCWSVMSH